MARIARTGKRPPRPSKAPGRPLMPVRPAVPVRPDRPEGATERAAKPRTKTVSLALQGGGSHGAFTWGVLDRLLEDDRLVIDGISGTSAGAMNAAVMAQGMVRDGREGAREALSRFWHRVADLSVLSPVRRTPLEIVSGQWNLDRSPLTAVLDVVQNMFSPYQTNPFDINPLRDMLAEMVVEKDIQTTDHFKIFVCATNVQTGRPRVFQRHELTVDAIMASATLPFTFQATEIDGVPYWDGGYMGNPSLWPLIYSCKSSDIVLVQINPLIRLETPKTPVEIINRVNEIGFNSSLMAEMRAIAFVQRLLMDGSLQPNAAKGLKMMHLHVIEAEEVMRELGAASKMNAEIDFLIFLRDLGRATANAWLAQTWDDIGVRTSVDVRERFLK